MFFVLVLFTALPRLAAPGLTCSDITPGTCGAFSEHLVQQLSARGLAVVSAQDIATVLGHERQRQLLGCSDDNSSCTAEIAGALGVESIVRGNIAAVRDTVIINVRVISASSAQPVATFSESVIGIDNVPASLERAAMQISETLGVPASSAWSSRRKLALVPAAVAVLSAVGGSIALVSAQGASNELRTKTGAGADYDPGAVASRGQAAATAGYVLLGVAGAAAVAAGVMFLLLGPSAPRASAGVALSPDGAAVVLGAALP